MLLTVLFFLYIASLTSAGLHRFFPCVGLSVKPVWPQTKTPVYLISFSRVSFRIWGQCLRGVSDLPLAPPQSLILSSILPSFLCFSSFSFIVFSFEQSLEIFKYLSTLHLFSGVATLSPKSCPSFPPNVGSGSLILFWLVHSLLTSNTFIILQSRTIGWRRNLEKENTLVVEQHHTWQIWGWEDQR